MTKTIMRRERSAALFAEARLRIPGGVNSPVRACANVGCDPVFYERAEGSRVVDVDGNEYVDFIGSIGGPMDPVGHRPPAVLEAVRAQMERGLSFGAPCEAEVRLAERICALVPCAEMARMVSSGTEATMSAVRLARGFTGRSLVVKFDGCYHGHSDALLANAGSGVATLGIPGYAGGDRGGRARHARRALQRPRSSRAHPLRARGPRGRRHRGARRGQHGRRAARPRLLGGVARAVRPGGRAPLSSTRSSAGSARRSAARRSVTA